MMKALLALLELPVWDGGDGSICNYSLRALRRESGESWGSYLKKEPFSQGFGKWKDTKKELVQKKMIRNDTFNSGLLLTPRQDAACWGWGWGMGRGEMLAKGEG